MSDGNPTCTCEQPVIPERLKRKLAIITVVALSAAGILLVLAGWVAA